MHYRLPAISQIKMNFISKNQGSGVTPLNPECSSSGCENTFLGTFCNASVYDVHYFVPNLTCESLGETPCTVKVDGNVLACTQESSCTDTNSCNGQSGAIIRCSGSIPNLDECTTPITVECSSETDSDTCSFAI
jgi:hypothetical protein